MQVPERGEFTTTPHPRGEVPEIIFREAVFWMHKALHVLGASEMHVDMGLPSWSLSSAYQSSYFAARSILAFFGVSVAEMQHISVVVDLCRDMQGMRPQRMAQIGAFEEEILFRSIGVLFDHRQVWRLFQRILRTASCTIWPEGWANYFAQLDLADLTKQRHGLHYQLHYWVLDDLHDFVHSSDFRNVAPTGTNRDLFDTEKLNFSLTVSTAMTRMALLLFKDICGHTNRLVEERSRMLNAFSIERHPLFSDTLLHDVAN